MALSDFEKSILEEVEGSDIGDPDDVSFDSDSSNTRSIDSAEFIPEPSPQERTRRGRPRASTLGETDRNVAGDGATAPTAEARESDGGRVSRSTGGNRAPSRPSETERAVSPTEHFPLRTEPRFPEPQYSQDAELSQQGLRVLRDLWSPPNNDRDIEHLAAYFSVPPVVIFRSLRDLELIPEEYSGETITLEWMLNDAKRQREREREARERLLRDNDGRDIERMFDYEEWAISTPLSASVPLQELVIGAADTTPLDYFSAEDEVRAQEIEKLLDLEERN